MIYYEDYRLKIIETDGKYTVYDEKIGGRAYYVNKSKEWIDEYIQRVLSKRKRLNKKNRPLPKLALWQGRKTRLS